jgi:hypothetical protein
MARTPFRSTLTQETAAVSGAPDLNDPGRREVRPGFWLHQWTGLIFPLSVRDRAKSLGLNA